MFGVFCSLLCWALFEMPFFGQFPGVKRLFWETARLQMNLFKHLLGLNGVWFKFNLLCVVVSYGSTSNYCKLL